MRDYRLYELNEDDFETLTSVLCRAELGTGTVVFAKGRDGGRDGKFTGTADRFPSKTSPWSGNFIIQAKHTSGRDASCSDNSFFGNQSSVVHKEVPRIKKLFENGELDNYLMFTNRKMSGESHFKIGDHIKNETSVINFELVGEEHISQMITLNREDVVKALPQIAQNDGPLRFSAQELAGLLAMLKDAGGKLAADSKARFIDLQNKNRLNNLSKRYFKLIQQDSSPYFDQIRRFLSDPRNHEFTESYNNTVADLNHTVIVNREDFASFEKVFEAIRVKILDEHPEAIKQSRLLTTLLHYMYWACDLGEKEDA